MTAWVLVADKSRAMLFSAEKSLSPLREVERFHHPACRAKLKELISDSHPNDRLNTVDDPKNHEAKIFAKKLTQFLRAACQRRSFSKLYIVASPSFLGLLRRKLDANTATMIAGAINKDLTQYKPEDIRRHLPHRL